MGDAEDKDDNEEDGAGVTVLKSVQLGASKSQGSRDVTSARTTSGEVGSAAAAGMERGGPCMLVGPPLSPRTKSKYWGASKSYGSDSVAIVTEVDVDVGGWMCGVVVVSEVSCLWRSDQGLDDDAALECICLMG